MRTLVISAALAAVAALALGAGSASAKSCGDAVINDWYLDGTIDARYPATCYRQALSKVDRPDAHLLRPARAARARPAVGRHARTACSGRGRRSPSRHARPQGHKSSGPIQRVLGELGPDRADSIPIPLMILGGVALLLIAAGAASVVVRRLNGRRNAP